ncbi:MAG: FkbM family methyltransferase [Thermoguttaceae bacterium]|nr:FkbM family methyltransferase [Thermoguttaceae bacterium]MDW8078686.1 FkbM family methyltransferase [Thermoguttaceae bacterium]
MLGWSRWLWWRLYMIVYGRIPRVLGLLSQKGLPGVWEALYFKVRHPLRTARPRGASYRLIDNVNGFRMLVDATDRGIAQELRLFGVHEPLATQLIKSFVRPGDCVLDIGANIGYYALLLSQLVGERGAVLAVEPHPGNFRLLCQNLRLNRVDNVWVAQAAVAATEGTAQLEVSHASNWHSLVQSGLRPPGRAITVATITVDRIRQLWGRPISLMRMDTEGYEGHILQGAKRTIAEDRPALVVEVHPAFLGPEGGLQFLEELLAAGYESRYVVLRSDDVPWHRSRHIVREFSLSHLLLQRNLFRARQAFTLFLEPAERAAYPRSMEGIRPVGCDEKPSATPEKLAA